MSGLAPSPRRAARGYAPLIVLLAAAAFTTMVPTTGLEAIRSEQAAGGGVVTVPGAPGQAGTATGAPGSATAGGSSAGGGGRPGAGPASTSGCADRRLQVPGDTYSPPCVTFSGDNGGATAKGVTADKIKITWRLATDTASVGAVQAAVGSGVDITDTPEDLRRTIEGLTEYFNTRFQLYGRKLDVDVFDGRGSGADELTGSGQDGANADAVTVASQKQAFLDASVGTAPYADALARRGVIATGVDYVSDEWYAERHPFVWGGVSCTQTFRQVADYMNKRIYGGNADHAGEGLKGRPRKIGLISPENSFYQDCVKTFLKDLAAKGNSVAVNLTYALDINTVSQDTSAIVARLAEEGITTVICFTDPVSPLFYTAKATQQRYFPEWLVTGVAATDSDIAGQQYDQQQWQHAFGIRTLAENTARRASVAYAAFKSVRPDQEPAGLALFGIYARLLQVALAVQAAGPNLTPETFGQGWQSYPGGTGLFGAWRGRANDHSLLVDAQEIYWDTDRTSGFDGLPGTYVATGPRYEVGQWPTGTPAVFPVSRLAARRPSPRALTVAAVAVLFVLTRVTPGAVPIGVVVQGVVFGATSGLLALGLVLTYQATRIVNFAHGAVGSVAGALGVSLYFGPGWPWWAAVIAGIVAGGVIGALVDALVIRRFASASRLTLTVATIGLAQLLGGISLLLPGWLDAPTLVGAFDTGLSDINVRLRPVLFTGNELLMVAVVPISVLGLVWFLQRTDAGIAVRAAAEDRDRARLLAVPVARLSTVVWTTAGVLAAVTVLLTAPSQGMANNLGVAPVVLLPALAAAVVAGMRSLSLAFVAAVALGVMDQLVRWHVHTKSVTTVVFLVVIVGALLVRRDALGRDEPGEASLVGGRPSESSVWASARSLPLVRAVRWSSLAALGLVVLAAPVVLSTTDVFLFTTGVIYAMVVVSLVALTGWGGQISLGQFAIVGVGGVVASNLVLRHNVDLFWALAAAGLAGAAMAVIIGLPALRIRGPFLAVSTLAFAVAADAYAFNPNTFQEWLPFSVDRPVLFGRWDLASETSFSYLALGLLAATVVLLAGLRRGRPGRSVLAVRDNTKAASALAVPVTRTRLSTFVLAGAVAGIAGGLHVHLLGGLGLHTYAPATSLVLFSMAVIGGIESVPGAIAGVVVIQVLGRLWPEYQLLLTGIGMLFLLLVVPGGLAEVGRRFRDRAVVRLLPKHTPEARLQAPATPADAEAGRSGPAATGLLACTGTEAAYGPLQVLFGVDLSVGEGEVVALLGTNGAGKSSVLRAITGLLPVSRGEVWFDGERIDGRSPEAIARAGIAMVPGGRGVFPGLTVAENLRVASWAFRRDAAVVAERREEVLDLLPALRDRLDQAAGSMSGGEQQMLALAQAFLGRPRLLLIDELSLGLAPTVVAMLLEVVRAKVADGVTVVIVEQSVNVALAVAERAVFLEKGEVRFTGPTAELLDRPDVLHAVFLPGVTTGVRTEPWAEPVEPLPGGVPALSCHGLRRRFGGVVAVDSVDLDVGAGQIVGLIGHNGAGKTTLFDLISGFTEPDEGRVVLEGVDVSSMGPADRAVRGLARSFQEARLFPSLDVVETLSVALDRHLRGRGDGFVAASLRLPAATDTERIVAARVEELVEQLGLGRYARTATGHLSTGTRRIVELACMLAADPRVLLLDEPSAGVAQRETEHLGPLLRRVQVETGCSIVIIEHDMPLLVELCDELVALERGAVITRGRPDEVLAHARVLESYLGTDETTIARSGARAR